MPGGEGYLDAALLRAGWCRGLSGAAASYGSALLRYNYLYPSWDRNVYKIIHEMI